MDRRNVFVSSVSSISKDYCIHTKNVFSLMDLHPEDKSYQKIKKHMDDCQVCEGAYKKFEFKNLEAKIHIPKPQIDSETKEIFENEIHELFKTLDLNEKALLRKKIKSNIKKIDVAGIEFIKNLASKGMIKTYVFGAALFVVLKQFFD